MHVEIWLAFAAASALLLVIPGPTILTVVSYSIAQGIIFFIAFLPQFIDPSTEAAPQLLLLGVTFVGLAALNSALYASFAVSARRLLASSKAQRGFNLLGGSLLSSAGIWALLAKRPA